MTNIIQDNPYVGPRAFNPDETLYGRDREVTYLRDLLIAERLVLLYSPSGAGKTSLIQAALMPALRREEFQVLRPVRVGLDMQRALDGPGNIANRYVFSTLLSLEAGQPPRRQMPPAALARLTLSEYLRERTAEIRQYSGVTLIFDQFEEVLTTDTADVAAKQEFFNQLGAALRDRRYWALFALREDYLAGLDPYLRPIPNHLQTTFRLDLLSVAAAHTAIQQPARRAGVTFTTAAAERLATDLSRVRVQRADGSIESQPGLYIEPVQLQVVCYRLWEQQTTTATGQGRREITEGDIVAIGDVTAALADYYAERLQAVSVQTGTSERVLRVWFDHLITPQLTRGQMLRTPPRTAGLDDDAIIGLIDAHLVRGEARAGATWYELAHDRLIEPVRTSNSAWEVAHLSVLQRQAALWETENRPHGLLLQDAALMEAETWADEHADELTLVEQNFLVACQEARDKVWRERRTARIIRWLAWVATLLFLLAALAAIYAVGQRNEATHQQAIAVAAQATSEVRRQAAERDRSAALASYGQALAARARALGEEQADLRLLLAIEAARRDRSPFVEQVLRDAIPSVIPHTYAHPNIVWDAQVKQVDGTQILLTADEDGIARIWRVDTGELLLRLHGYTDRIYSAMFSPDGQRVLTASADGTLRFWDRRTGELLHTFVADHGPARCVGFAPDGQQFVAGYADGTALVWNIGTEDISLTLQGEEGSVMSAAFHPNGQQILTASLNGTAYLWDATTGAQLSTFTGNKSRLIQAAFSFDGSRIVAAWSSGDVYIWNSRTAELGLTLAGHKGGTYTASISPSGARIATGGEDGIVRIWDAYTGVQLDAITVGTRVIRVTFTPDGQQLVTASEDQLARIWTINRNVLHGHTRALTSVAFSPDSKCIVSSSEDGTARIWDVVQGVQLHMLEGHRDVVSSAFFSPDGKRIVTASWDGTARIWDVATGSVIYTLRGHTKPLTSAHFSPDGKRIATTSQDGTLRLWDATTSRALQVIRGDKSALISAAFSPDGTNIVTTDEDGIAIIWGVDTGKEIRRLHEPENDIQRAVFSPDSRQILTTSGGSIARLWDAEHGVIVRAFAGHSASILNAVFSPDGQRVITASADGTARVWETNSGREWFRLDENTADAVTDAAFSPDGKRIVIVGDNNTLHLYYANIDDVLNQARLSVTRSLSNDERRTYLGGK